MQSANGILGRALPLLKSARLAFRVYFRFGRKARVLRERISASLFFDSLLLSEIFGKRYKERGERFLTSFIFGFLLRHERAVERIVVRGTASRNVSADVEHKGILSPDRSLQKGSAQSRVFTARQRLSSFVVFVHSESNWHIKLHAILLKDIILDAGYEARLAFEDSDVKPSRETPIFVAPHEFWQFPGTRHLDTHSLRSLSIAYQTEQPQTKWFREALPYLFESRAIIDVSSSSISLYKNWIPAVPLMLPFDSRSLSALGLDPAGESIPHDQRKYDISFFGEKSKFRDAVMERLSDFLPDYRVFVRTRDKGVPGGEPAARLKEFLDVTTNSRIHLSLSRNSTGFFTWDRIVLGGMYSQALSVVSRATVEDVVTQGEHYLSVSAQQLPRVLEYLLSTDQGKIFAADVAAQAKLHVGGHALRETAVGRFTKLVSTMREE